MKKEIERLEMNSKHQQELERIRAEEDRKTALLTKQMEENQNRRNNLYVLYAKMVETLYDMELRANPQQLYNEILSCSVRVLEFCDSGSSLECVTIGLISFLEDIMTSGRDCNLDCYDSVCYQVQSIGTTIQSFLTSPTASS